MAKRKNPGLKATIHKGSLVTIRTEFDRDVNTLSVSKRSDYYTIDINEHTGIDIPKKVFNEFVEALIAITNNG